MSISVLDIMSNPVVAISGLIFIGLTLAFLFSFIGGENIGRHNDEESDANEEVNNVVDN